MRGGLIIWNADNVRHLEDMIRQAKEEGSADVSFVNGPRSRFSAKPTHTFSMQEAERLLHDARADLARSPMPVFGENREGEEP